MTSSRPYLVRALYEWIVDNGNTPYLLVNASYEGVVVPQQYIQDGKIVLNIAASAVQNLELGNELVGFNARFSGKAMQVHVPIGAVLAIYAMENGKGMVFAEEGETEPTPPQEPQPDKPVRPSLKVVK